MLEMKEQNSLGGF